ncbi:MAG: signal peptide peptidase SppA [Bacteroidia bacterium]|nr:signal peptide peptidase SppA [Bacteroidia bacterium]
MKQFFGAFFGSCLGILITGIVITAIVIASVASMVTDAVKFSDGKAYTPKENSILKLSLDNEIKERGVKNPFGEVDLGPFMPKQAIGLDQLLTAVKKAKDDKNIKGIYLDISNPVAGFATLEEVRNALIDFKKSKKFIVAYSEVLSQKAYYVASVSDKIYLNPEGGMELKGLSTQMMFFKNMLEKLDMEVQIFRHGKFKSAIEPFMLDKMSEANRLQTKTYLGSLWNHMTEGISIARNLTPEYLNNIADSLLLRTPSDALKYKLIDDVMYEDEVFSNIKKTIKVKETEKVNLVALSDYVKSVTNTKVTKDKIAVIYAVGEIESGEGDDDKIGSIRIAKAIKDARLDENVKAIVLRVNSPGGSALASDVIWRETVLAKKVKPFIVSMGDVAASGGYYISCAADRIFAQPNTITGSIGVFGLIPNAQKALSEKLGITIDTVNTNKHSDVGTILRKASTEEYNYIQQSVEHVYDVFTKKVAEGRKTTQSAVDSVGQGRVWSGADAIKINLVDELGGINEAIAYAAKQAKLSEYKIQSLPKQKDPIEELLGNTKEEIGARVMQENLGIQYQYLKQIKNVLMLKGVQARLPYEMVIE